jgi:NADP-dependent 3-hydroxy acid dehydrogenase YdfG
MRLDLHGTGIRVTEIVPGMVKTDFSLVRLRDEDKAAAVYENATPLTAEDIADSIAWCVSRPKHVNIQELVIYPTTQAAPGMVVRNK